MAAIIDISLDNNNLSFLYYELPLVIYSPGNPMEINYLKSFLAVARYESFSRAAEETHLSQPAISKRIAQLEQELKVKLFDRIGRRVQITEAGQIFLERARHLINEYEYSLTLLDQSPASTGGVLSIGISHHLGLHRLPRVLKEFRQDYPAVRLDIQFMDSERAYESVARGDIELAAITLASHEEPRVQTIPLWNDRLLFVCAKDHELVELSAADRKCLANFPCCLPSTATYTGRIIEQAFHDQGLRLEPVLVTNYMETLARMAEVGLGWSVIPETLFQSDRLHQLPVDFELARQLGLILNANRTITRAARAFIQTASPGAGHEMPHQPDL